MWTRFKVSICYFLTWFNRSALPFWRCYFVEMNFFVSDLLINFESIRDPFVVSWWSLTFEQVSQRLLTFIFYSTMPILTIQLFTFSYAYVHSVLLNIVLQAYFSRLKCYTQLDYFWRPSIHFSFRYFRILPLEVRPTNCRLFMFHYKDCVRLRKAFLIFTVTVGGFGWDAFWFIQTSLSMIGFIAFTSWTYHCMIDATFLFPLSVWLKWSSIVKVKIFYLGVNLFLSFNWVQSCRWFFKDQGFCSWWYLWESCFLWGFVNRLRQYLRVGFLIQWVPFLRGYFPFISHSKWVQVCHQRRVSDQQNVFDDQ